VIKLHNHGKFNHSPPKYKIVIDTHQIFNGKSILIKTFLILP
jgi:hypothetical protein